MMPSRISTLAEGRAHYATLDRLDRMERMVCDIALGVPRERSAAVVDAEDARAWVLLAAEVKDIIARGQMVVLGYPYYED